jgi:Ti-type conjugative transfer relaxase TraA
MLRMRRCVGDGSEEVRHLVAIYHLTAKVISREKGRSAVAAAAYRAGESLYDERLGQTFDYTRKRGVHHTEILAPKGAPDWIYNRERLWNVVEACEKRKDAQLAREIEIGLPRELDAEAQIALLRDFVRREFVNKGMVADFSLHRDNLENPHAHILLTFRRISANGFGLKERSWNARSNLQMWRAGWEEVANEHLARVGLDIRIDHRTLKAQEIDLIPGRKIGVSLDRQQDPALPRRIAERVEEQRRIARLNGESILSDPTIALRALTHQQATFTKHDIARFLNTRTDGPDQFRTALLRVTTSAELVALGHDDRGQQRYTTREMLDLEEGMLHRTELMTLRAGHGTGRVVGSIAIATGDLSSEQAAAFKHLIGEGDLKGLVGVAGSGKSRLLAEARAEWEAAGWTVKGAALSGIAAENLTDSSGIPARTLASYEYGWKNGRDQLTSKDVLVIDEAGMVGTRQMAMVLEAAEAAHAKIVLVGDSEQLQAIEAGAAFRGIIGQAGAAELDEVRRQNHAWQREATRQFAKGATADALAAYVAHDAIVHSQTREDARSALVTLWAHDGKFRPEESRLMLAYTRDDVHQLNELAREVRRERGELGHAENIETERGTRQFAVGDRLYFLRPEKSLGVKNGSLGTVELVNNGVLQVRLDRTKESVSVDTRFYRDLDHGYAATAYKAQGATVDRSYVLASPYFDRHSTYVALSRHREAATMFYAAEDFAGKLSWQRTPQKEIHDEFTAALSRARPKDLAHDYLEPSPEADLTDTLPSYERRDVYISMEQIDAQQQAAAERWREKQRAQELHGTEQDHSADLHEPLELSEDDPLTRNSRHELSRDGLEDDLDL